MELNETRLSSFLDSLEEDAPEWLQQLESEALRDNIPIIRKETQRLLRFLVRSQNPAKILEIGTATGFSALLMWEASGGQARITTIEKYEKRIPIAREHFRQQGAEGITLLEGDAADVLKELTGTWPMIFMDAAKGQYESFLPQVLRLLGEGGLLITDNIFQEGDILESRYAVRRRDRTIHSRMRDFLYEIKHTEGLETLLMNNGDGVAISCKKRNRNY